VVRCGTILASVLLMLAGCGDSSGPAASRTTAPSAPPAAKPAAPTLVFFQRQGAGGATLDTFTVRRDGTARLEKRYGGAGGRFKDLVLRAGVMPELRRALARLPRAGGTLTRGSPQPGGAQYLVRYRGRTLTGRQGAIAPAARPAVKLLDGFIDGIGVRRTTRESATNNP
jgi:hypothetical protein